MALTTTSIEVVFSEGSTTPARRRPSGSSRTVEGAFSWSANTLVFTPEERLPLETDFVVSVEPGVRDAAGNAMEQAGRASPS